MKKNLQILFVCLLIFIEGLVATATKRVEAQQIPDDFCITTKEKKLLQDINNWRNSSRRVGDIPFSLKLSYIARLHAQDIYENQDINNQDCDFHSWSDKGFWEACCHSKGEEEDNCAKMQAIEIIGYKAGVAEVIYKGSLDKVMAHWEKSKYFSNLVMQRSNFAEKKHKAMGVGIYKDIICFWLGEETDPTVEPQVCDEDMPPILAMNRKKHRQQEDIPSGEVMPDEKLASGFYLIYGSYGTLEYAKDALKKVKNSGFERALILDQNENGRFRIALQQFETRQNADKARENLDNKAYPDTWILTK
ncbi:MAG: SPOR domain-containing protein [Bernardetiaceae bacterium]|nr:SPOR domain-containing protein [Bernardetiaceae bacterium]